MEYVKHHIRGPKKNIWVREMTKVAVLTSAFSYSLRLCLSSVCPSVCLCITLRSLSFSLLLSFSDKDKYKKARYAAENAFKTGKAKYRDKLEENLTSNNYENIWQDLKVIANYKPSPKNTTATDTNFPDRLNYFYSQFEKLNTTSPSSITPTSSLPPFTVDEYVVRSMFQRLNSRKADGPESYVCLNCVPTSCRVYSHTYSLCLFPNVKYLIASKS